MKTKLFINFGRWFQSRNFSTFYFYFLTVGIALMILLLVFLAYISGFVHEAKIGIGDFNNLVVSGEPALQISYTLSTDENANPQVTSSIFRIWLPDSIIGEEPICFTEVSFKDLTHKQSALSLSHRSSPSDDEEYCIDSGGYLFYNKTDVHESEGTVAYFYPYDTVHVNTIYWLDLIKKNDPQKEIFRLIPSIIGNARITDQWEVTVQTQKITTGDDQGYMIDVLYERPLIYRIIIPVMLVLLVSVILFLPKLQEPSSYFEIMIGILFGIWGIREVLLPNYVTWPTMLEPIFLILYILIAFVTLIKFVLVPLRSKMDELADKTHR